MILDAMGLRDPSIRSTAWNYSRICRDVPPAMKGTGLDNFGNKGRPDTVPFPYYTEDDLIARIDAVGCASPTSS